MFEAGAHVGEEAELYALGQLDDAQRARLERHVANCVPCSQRVGEAETTVLHLVELQTAGDPVPARPADGLHVRRTGGFAPWVAAIAAAFAIGLIPWIASVTRDRAAAPSEVQRLADTAMLEGHFLHAPFTPLAADAPNAKVIYGRQGGWLYVLAASAARPLDVVVLSGRSRKAVATIPAGTGTRSAFVRAPGRYDAVELDEDGRPVASVKLVYAAR